MSVRDFRAGELVRVKIPREILATLDAEGAFEGVPFMPEMLESCGETFRVQHCVVKTCVDGHPRRRFPGDDVVILDGPRCDGAAHDGCKHGCRIFWKQAWLDPSAGDGAALQDPKAGLEELRARLKVKSDEQRYYCQSTELYKSTEAFPADQRLFSFWIAFKEMQNGDMPLGEFLRLFARLIWQRVQRRLLLFRIAFKEMQNGDMPLGEFLRLFARWIWQRVQRRMGADQRLRGPHKNTPHGVLDLKPGELVRVKSQSEIVATLDGRMRNRGLGICHEMMRCCGGEAEVRYRVDRLINERTGVMRELTATVALKVMKNSRSLNEECLCYCELGDCPRGELMYWREIWLERVNPEAR
jgi:hypothetical protein